MRNSRQMKSGESPFESIRRVDRRGDHWFARQLQITIGYPTWEEMQSRILQAMDICAQCGRSVANHFQAIPDHRYLYHGPMEDYRLSFAACRYIIATDARDNAPIQEARQYFPDPSPTLIPKPSQDTGALWSNPDSHEAIHGFLLSRIQDRREAYIPRTSLFSAARAWIKANRPAVAADDIPVAMIGTILKKVYPQIRRFRPCIEGKRVDCYQGIEYRKIHR